MIRSNHSQKHHIFHQHVIKFSIFRSSDFLTVLGFKIKTVCHQSTPSWLKFHSSISLHIFRYVRIFCELFKDFESTNLFANLWVDKLYMSRHVVITKTPICTKRGHVTCRICVWSKILADISEKHFLTFYRKNIFCWNINPFARPLFTRTVCSPNTALTETGRLATIA